MSPAPDESNSWPPITETLGPPTEQSELARRRAENARTMPAHIGHYEALGLLGSGGAANVYSAHDPTTGRAVAIKIARPGAEGAQLDLFRREPQVAVACAHPNVIPVYATGEYDGSPYFVMELFAGGSMAERVREPAPPCAALRWVREVARALERVHARGFVHWDPKPGNVLLSSDGARVVLTDFGLAMPIDGPDREFVAGTATYMSPEQWQPGGAHRVGPLSDVYVLGGALFHALTGARPIEGHTLHDIQLATCVDATRRRPSDALPGLGTGFDDLCLRALQRNPADRYPSAAAFGAALDAHLARLADEHAG